MGANDVIQTISIGLGLDVSQLEAEARDGMARLDKVVPKRMERILTLRAKVDPGTAGIDQAVRQIEQRLNQNLKKALQLTPKFTVTSRAAGELRREIEAGLKGQPVRVPITVAKIDGRQMRQQILEAIGTPSIPFTWHWSGDAPPGGAIPAGGGGGRSGPPPRTGGGSGRGSPAPASPPPPAPPTAVAPAPLTAQPRQRTARGQTTPPTARSAAPAPAVAITAPTGAPPRLSIDELRARPGHQYTEEEKLAHLYERSLPIAQRREQTRGVRGARLGGIANATPADIAAIRRLSTPEEVARRQIYRARHEEMAQSMRRDLGKTRSKDADYVRAKQLVDALNSVQFDANGVPDVSRFSSLATNLFGSAGESLASGYWSLLMGDPQGAGIAGREANAAFRPLSGVNKAGKKMRRIADPGDKKGSEGGAQDVLVFSALAGAMTGEASIAADRNARVRKATRTGKSHTLGSGNVQAFAADDKYFAALRRAKPFLMQDGHEYGDLEGVTQKDVIPQRPDRETVEQRRQRLREDRALYTQRVAMAKSRGLTFRDFMSSPEGQRHIEENLRPGRRAGGGRVNRFNLDEMRAAQSGEAMIASSPRSPVTEAGGALQFLLRQTLDEGGAIRSGMTERSQMLNQIIEQQRGGWGGKRGGAYWVGEKGRKELFVPDESGYIIPDDIMAKIPKRAAGGRVDVMGKTGFISPSKATGFISGHGEITRVFVVNWPTGSPQAQTQAAAAPVASRRAPAAQGSVQAPQAAAPGAVPGLAAIPGAPGAQGMQVVSLRRSNAQMGQEARAQARDAAEIYANKLTAARTNISEALQLSPVRALSVAFGQIMQTAAGGRSGILERRDIAQAAANRAGREVSELQRYETGVFDLDVRMREAQSGRGIPTGIDPGAYMAEIQRSRDDQEAARQAQIPRVESAVSEAEEASKRVINKRQATRAQAVGAMGIAVGTIAFTALMQVAQVATALFGKALGDATDRLSGFAGTTARATEALAPSATAVMGSPRAGLAQQFARLGVSGSDFGQTSGMATRLAGAQNLMQVVDLMRSENRLRAAGNPNVVPGVGTGFNNGPLAGIGLGVIGQTPGSLEQLGGLVAGSGGGPLGGLPGPLGWLFGATAGLQDQASGRPLTSDPNTQAGAKAIAEQGRKLPIIGGFFDDWAKNLDKQNDAQAFLVDNLDQMNERIRRTMGGAGEFRQTSDQRLLDATVKAFKEAGNEFAGQQLAQSGVAVVGAGGSDATASLVNMIGKAALTLLPSREELVNMIRPQVSGQLGGIEVQGRRQRSELLPTQLALGLVRQPQLAPSQGIVPTGLGGTFGPTEIPASALQSMTRYTQLVDQAQGEVRGLATAGQDWLRTLPPAAQQAISSLKAISAEIAGLRAGAENIQLNFQFEQMNRQRELALRSTSDLVGMAGKEAEAVRMVVGFDAQRQPIYDTLVVRATELGRLQRQQLNLSREGQRIEFAQAQRQINFGLALAQIEVPGATPAEMASRVANAKILSEEAQQRLDRERNMFELSTQIQDIGISRDAQDTIKSLQELSQGQAVTIETQNIERAIGELQTAQGAIDAYVQSFVGEQQAVEQALIEAWLATETQMNSFQERYNSTIDASLSLLQAKYADLLLGTGTTTTPPIMGPNTPGAPPGWNQTPAGGSDLGATLPSMRGAGSLHIHFDGPVHVRDDSDLDAIARKVEQRMNGRAVLVGLGG